MFASFIYITSFVELIFVIVVFLLSWYHYGIVFIYSMVKPLPCLVVILSFNAFHDIPIRYIFCTLYLCDYTRVFKRVCSDVNKTFCLKLITCKMVSIVVKNKMSSLSVLHYVKEYILIYKFKCFCPLPFLDTF